MDIKEKDLQELCDDWDGLRNNVHHIPLKITTKHVMLILKHSGEFDGLHEMLLAALKPLVEEIVQPMLGAQYAPAELAHNGAGPQGSQETATDSQEENARLKEENDKLRPKISTLEEEAKKDKAARESVAESDRQRLSECELERDTALEKLAQTEKELETVQTQLNAAQSVARQLPVEHLGFVRGDGEVLRLFFPGGLPEDDALAMLGVVAVFAQESSLKRLFDCLSERCKSGQRSAGKQELALLHAALGWFNTQWAEDKRYSLLQVQPGDAFDFNCHTRIGSQTGERVKKMLLPGLADGFGVVLKKVQVQTQS